MKMRQISEVKNNFFYYVLTFSALFALEFVKITYVNRSIKLLCRFLTQTLQVFFFLRYKFKFFRFYLHFFHFKSAGFHFKHHLMLQSPSNNEGISQNDSQNRNKILKLVRRKFAKFEHGVNNVHVLEVLESFRTCAANFFPAFSSK